MHRKEIITAGIALQGATKALIMLHGRGATARDILGLADHLPVGDFALLAPQATNYTWYPYSFLAPPPQNEPWLSSALQLLSGVVDDLERAGISSRNIFFTGFSQGACLALEFVARNARRWGGAIAFTGGLIGDTVDIQRYRGDFKGTPVFIGTSDPDPHVPLARVRETTRVLRDLNADVSENIYPGIGHTITQEEISAGNTWVFGKR